MTLFSCQSPRSETGVILNDIHCIANDIHLSNFFGQLNGHEPLYSASGLRDYYGGPDRLQDHKL